MLVLSRKVGERIHVGDNIVLEIRRIAGNRVTVALEAPRDVRILRGELEGPAREFRTPELKARNRPRHWQHRRHLACSPVCRRGKLNGIWSPDRLSGNHSYFHTAFN